MSDSKYILNPQQLGYWFMISLCCLHITHIHIIRLTLREKINNERIKKFGKLLK